MLPLVSFLRLLSLFCLLDVSQASDDTLKGKKVLVIGGSGKKGSAIVKNLMSHGAYVTILSRGETPQYKKTLESLTGDGAKFVKFDLGRQIHEGQEANPTKPVDVAAIKKAFSEANFDIVVDVALNEFEKFQDMVKALRNDDGNGWRVKQYIWLGAISSYRMCQDQNTRIFGKKRKDTITEDDYASCIEDEKSIQAVRSTTWDRRKVGERFYAWGLIHKELVRLWKEEQFPFTYLQLPEGDVVSHLDAGEKELVNYPNFHHFEHQLIASTKLLVRTQVLVQDIKGRPTLHVDDLAEAVSCAVQKPDVAVGEHFHILMDEAVTLTDYLDAVAKAVGNNQFGTYAGGLFSGGFFTPIFSTKWGLPSVDKAKSKLGWKSRPLATWMKEVCDEWTPQLTSFFKESYLPMKDQQFELVSLGMPSETIEYHKDPEAYTKQSKEQQAQATSAASGAAGEEPKKKKKKKAKKKKKSSEL